MTDKITLTNLVNLQNETTAVNAINTNNAAITAAFDNTLSRDGTTPNQMGANLDMNSNQILNLPAPSTNYDPIRAIDVSLINSGGITVSPLPAGGTTGQFLEKNSGTNYDVVWGVPTGLTPTGGSFGQVLTKRSSTNFDTDWETPKDQTFNPKNYGAKGDGTTDDTAAINACIAAAVAVNGNLTLTDGNYAHNSTLTWAYPSFKVVALGSNVIFTHTASGVAHNFNGLTHGSPTEGCMKGVFGGANRITLKGNPAGGTTKLAYVTNWHFGDMKIRGRDAQYILYCDNAFSAPTGASAVTTTFDVQVSSDADQSAFAVTPDTGLYLDSCFDCYFAKPVVESCGAHINYGIRLINSSGNTFDGGTVESNTNGGISIDTNSTKNVFVGTDAESNGAGLDWFIQGSNNLWLEGSGAGTSAGSSLTGNFNIFEGTTFQSMVVQSGATLNRFISPKLFTAFTDSGTNTTITGSNGAASVSDKVPFSGVVSNTLNFNGETSINVTNNSTAGSARADFFAGNSNGGASFGVGGSGHTDLPLLANRAYILSGGVLSGIVLDSLGTNPIVFAVNNVEAGRFTSAGALTLVTPLAAAQGGTGVTANTGTGNNVLSTSATLVTPILGTPTSGTLTSCTGLPLTTGVTGTLPRANGGGATSVAGEQAALGIGLYQATITGVNFNSGNTDNAIAFTMPTGYTRLLPFRVNIAHASASLNATTFGMFSTTAGGGSTILASTANSIGGTTDGSVNNASSTSLVLTTTFVAASLPTPNTVYFRVLTPQGSAATADVTLIYFVMP